jgi:hypothetical protein
MLSLVVFQIQAYRLVMKRLIRFLASLHERLFYGGFSADPVEREKELAEWQTY